jgi:hypothetical protein
MESKYKLNLPESHLNILRLVSAMVWADGNFSEDELNLLIHEFNADLPPDIRPAIYWEETLPFVSDFANTPTISKQLSERISAELALKEIILDYQDQATPLSDLVAKLETQEDRCLALKLSYMVIKASSNNDNEALINLDEKKAYRNLVELLNLKEDLVKTIEAQAEQDLTKFQHPFKAFLSNIKQSLGLV